MNKPFALVFLLVTACASAPLATVTDVAGTDRRMIEGKAYVRTLAQGANAWIGILELSPGLEVPLHKDLTEEYVVVIEGGGTIWIDGKKSTLSKGSTAFMPAGAEVRFTNGDRQTAVIQVFAGPRSAQKYKRWSVNPAKDD